MQCIKCSKKVYANEVCECGEKAPKKNNGAVRANSIICFILVILSVLCLVATLSLRSVVTKNLIVESIEEIEIEKIEIDGKMLNQYIFDEYINDERVSIENVDNLLKEPFIKDFLIEKVEAYQDFALNNAHAPTITADEIVNLITENEEKIYNEVGLRFLEPDKEELRESLSSLDEFAEYTEKELNDTFQSKAIQTFFSYANVVFLIVFMVVVFIQWIIVYKMNSRRASKVFGMYGVAVIIPSALILASVIVLKVLPKLDIIDELLASVKTPFMIYSIILLAVGIVLEVIAVMFGKKRKVLVSDTPEAITVNTEVTEKTVSENICPECSHSNKETAAFCSRCGAKLK